MTGRFGLCAACLAAMPSVSGAGLKECAVPLKKTWFRPLGLSTTERQKKPAASL